MILPEPVTTINDVFESSSTNKKICFGWKLQILPCAAGVFIQCISYPSDGASVLSFAK